MNEQITLPLRLLYPPTRYVEIPRLNLNPNEPSPQPRTRYTSRTAAHEWVEDSAFGHLHAPQHQSNGLLRGVNFPASSPNVLLAFPHNPTPDLTMDADHPTQVGPR
jgi:hypothetical protein